MRHEHKILLALVFVAVLPAALSGTLALSAARRGLEAHSTDLLVSLSREASGFLRHEIDRSVQSIASVLALPRGGIARFTPEQREAFLSVVYHLFDGHTAVALVDPSGGEAVQQIHRRPEDRGPGLERHPAATDADVAAFLASIPLDDAVAHGRATSTLYLAGGDPRVAVAVLARSPGEKRYVLATEISLQAVREHLAHLLPRNGGAVLADAGGRTLLAVGTAQPFEKLRGPEQDSGSGPVSLDLTGVSGPLALDGDRLAAADWLPGPRVSAVVFQDAATAAAASQRIFWQALAWLGASLVIALVLGFVLSRGLAAPVRAMAGAARRIGGGALGEQVPVAERGELGMLARAFNEMSADLRRKQDEIEAWNRELQTRVEQKTEELGKLQKVAARAQRQAALAGLSAGLAHEINNPLQVVLGMAQLARRQAPEGPLAERLGMLEREARRIAEIIQRLMQLGEGRMEDATAIEFDVDGVIDAAAKVLTASRAGRRVELEHRRASGGALVLGYPNDLREGFAHLLQNSLEASPEGEAVRIEVASEVVEEVVRVTLRDWGRGIDKAHLDRVFDPFFTTKQTWSGKGLGLAVAHRAVAVHRGEIAIESEPGQGTTVTITLPLAKRGTLLA